MNTASLLSGLHLDSKGFKQLLDAQLLVDCTLACDGGKISAHKIVLSACSSYLAKILMEHPVEHPIIVLPELEIEDVKTLVHYMYTGELLKSNTLHSTSLLRTAAILSVNSLNDLLNNPTSATATANVPPLGNHLYFNSATPTNFLNHNLSSSILTPTISSNTNTNNNNNLNQTSSSLTSSSSTSPISLISNPIVNTGGTKANQNSNASSPNLIHNNSSIVINTNETNNSTNNHQTMITNSSNCLNLLNSSQYHELSQSKITCNLTTGGLPASANSSGSKSEFQFKCPVCQNDFQTICSFEYHMQRIHNVTSFGCEICHKPFASLRYVLTDHMRRCHGSKSIM